MTDNKFNLMFLSQKRILISSEGQASFMQTTLQNYSHKHWTPELKTAYRRLTVYMTTEKCADLLPIEIGENYTKKKNPNSGNGPKDKQ